MPPSDPPPSPDPTEVFVREAVAERGWAIVIFDEEDGAPALAYTVGLGSSYGHPELIAVGLPTEALGDLLNACAERVNAGLPVPVGAPINGVLGEVPIRLRPVQERASYATLAAYACWFHGDDEFSLLQVLWPDRNGMFPDEPGAPESLARQQPVLP